MIMKGTYTLRRIFPSLTDDDLLLFQESSSVIKLRKGQNLFIAGDSASSIYCVAHGCFKVIREGQEGESVVTRIVQAGDIVGIREVFGEFKYSRTCVALKEAEVYSIEKEHVLLLIQKNASISLQFMKMFSKELTRVETRIESRLHRAAKNRVASAVLELFHLFAHNDSQVFDAPVSRRDIAELCDVTPETVSRCLAELKQSGLLQAHGSTFTILDLAALQHEAEER